MSTTLKISIVVVAVILIGLGIWSFMGSGQPTSSTNYQSTTSSTNTTNSSDTSDAALDKDIAGVDASMSALNNDSASADAGLNDKPVEQVQ